MKPEPPGLPFDDPVGAFCRENHVALEGSGAGACMVGKTHSDEIAYSLTGEVTVTIIG